MEQYEIRITVTGEAEDIDAMTDALKEYAISIANETTVVEAATYADMGT